MNRSCISSWGRRPSGGEKKTSIEAANSNTRSYMRRIPHPVIGGIIGIKEDPDIILIIPYSHLYRVGGPRQSYMSCCRPSCVASLFLVRARLSSYWDVSSYHYRILNTTTSASLHSLFEFIKSEPNPKPRTISLEPEALTNKCQALSHKP